MFSIYYLSKINKEETSLFSQYIPCNYCQNMKYFHALHFLLPAQEK